MKLAVLLLCHEPAATIARRLGSAFYRSPEVKVYLHHDRASPHHDRAAFEAALPGSVQWQWLQDATACRWGDWSLVEATLLLARAALTDPDFACDRLLLASGSCRPIRPWASLRRFLVERAGIEFIEAHDLDQGRWTRDGLERERFEYWFPFNYQSQRRRFELATALQRRLGVRRRLPAGLRPHFGSQWWCLTRPTLAAVVDQLGRPALAAYFSRCWIPDEFAIQSLVAGVCPPGAVAGHGLTYSEFDAQGKPLVLEDWHAGHVSAQPFFFARKISTHARSLEAALDARVAAADEDRSWFDRVGTPTLEFGHFLQRVRDDPARRARVGSFRLEEGGPMAASDRRYYVLVGSSRAHVARVLARARALARQGADLPILDFPFQRAGLQPAPERLRAFGIGPDDRRRGQLDELGMLYELVHLAPGACTAFGLDTMQPTHVRNHLPRDPHAVVVDCDPPGLDRSQRLAMGLRHVGGAHEHWLSEATRQAWGEGAALPQDALRRARLSGWARCRFARLSEATAFDDETWRVLTAAGAGVAEADFVPSGAWAKALVHPK